MFSKFSFIVFILVLIVKACLSQVLMFGECIEVETMTYFSIDKFLGKWYEIQKFPIWYTNHSHCSYKQVQACGRRIQVEHTFVKEGIKYILHVNSTYAPGDEAILKFQETNIDPMGIPINVITTDYTNYALIYGCKYRADLDLKYVTAWIMSRNSSLSSDLLAKARDELQALPHANVVYLQTVDHSEDNCAHHWTANVQVENYYDENDDD